MSRTRTEAREALATLLLQVQRQLTAASELCLVLGYDQIEDDLLQQLLWLGGIWRDLERGKVHSELPGQLRIPTS